ncbi:MAG: haloacid dehalogenase type II [Acidobacteriota bacterium]
MNLRDFDVLTFDCYGTLIDWETGIHQALTTALPELDRSRDEVLEAFARHESAVEAETPHRLYPEILARVFERLESEWGLSTNPGAAELFGASVGDWPAFDDSPAALRMLQQHFKLVILSNIDRRSFAASEKRLGVTFDHVFTAEDIGSYKPDPRNFHYALDRLAEVGVTQGKILHTAQSLFHDHVPASELGLATCWIDRRHDTEGWGATMPPPENVKVDFRFESLGAMAEAVSAA